MPFHTKELPRYKRLDNFADGNTTYTHTHIEEEKSSEYRSIGEGVVKLYSDIYDGGKTGGFHS